MVVKSQNGNKVKQPAVALPKLISYLAVEDKKNPICRTGQNVVFQEVLSKDCLKLWFISKGWTSTPYDRLNHKFFCFFHQQFQSFTLAGGIT